MRRGGTKRSSYPFSPGVIRLIVLAVLASLLTTVTLDNKKAEARPADRIILRAAAKYMADFTSSSSRGIGLRVTTDDQNRYLDLRLKGVQGSDPTINGGIYTYTPSANLSLHYDVFPNRIKETIVSRDTSKSEFRFVLRATGLNAQQEGSRIVLRAQGRPQIVIDPSIAWDANRNPIPAKMALEGDEVVVRLDPLTLAASTAPITIDPPIYMQSCGGADPEGGTEVGCGGGGSPDIRTTFVTPDSDVIAHFYRDVLQADGTARILVSASTDGGATFTTETVTTLSVGDFSVHQAPDGVFLLSYSKVSPSQSIGYREVTLGRDANGNLDMSVSNEPTQPLLAPGITALDAPLITQYGATGTDRHLAIGYHSYNQVLGDRYLTYVTEDGGDTWTPGICSPSATKGTLSALPGRPLCFTLEAGKLVFRDLTDTGWSTALDVVTAGSGLPTLPSSVITDDGALHIVSSRKNTGSSPPETLHAFLTPTATAFSAPQVLGPGDSPMISTGGTSLHVYATEVISVTSKADVGESVIRPYIATDGITFIDGKPLTGEVFDYVLDYNAAWEWTDTSTRDALFLLVDGTGAIGNGIGTSEIPHKLDHPSKRLSFSFIPDLAAGTTATLTSVDLFLKAEQSSRYRIGIQADSSGVPSGTWLDQVEVAGQIVSGAYADLPAGSHAYKWVSADIQNAAVSAGTRYHLVAETIPDPTGLLGGTASSTKWIELRAIGAASESVGTLSVLDGSSSGWTQAPSQVPRFVVRAGATNLANQVLEPGLQDAAHEYSLPGESFIASRDITPTEIKVRLSKVNNPSSSVSVTVRLLDSGGTELFSSAIASPQVGWALVPMSGVSLTEGSRYQLLIDSLNKGLGAYWALDTSRGNGPGGGITAASSWDGATSVGTLARDRKGFNDRSYEAERSNPFPYEINLFNSSTSDALYVGDDQPFDFITLIRDLSGTIQTLQLNYFDGSSWSAVTATSITYNGLGRIAGGYADFTPPTDWQQTTVDGKTTYWMKVVSNAATPTRIRADRITSIRNYTEPGVAPRLGVAADVPYVPLAVKRNNLPAGTLFEDYDAVGPNIPVGAIFPADGGNTRFLEQPVLALIFDTESGINPATVSFEVTDLHSGVPLGLTGLVESPDLSSGWVASPPFDLTLSHSYRTEVVAADNAGNQTWARQTSGFLTVGLLPQDASTAQVLASPCEVIPTGASSRVSCLNATAAVSTGTLELSSSQRPGRIDATRHINFDSLRVDLYVGSSLVSSRFPKTGETITITTTAAVTISSTPQAVTLESTAVDLDAVELDVGPEITAATLTMEGAVASAEVVSCRDSIVIDPPRTCTPDVLSLAFASRTHSPHVPAPPPYESAVLGAICWAVEHLTYCFWPTEPPCNFTWITPHATYTAQLDLEGIQWGFEHSALSIALHGGAAVMVRYHHQLWLDRNPPWGSSRIAWGEKFEFAQYTYHGSGSADYESGEHFRWSGGSYSTNYFIQADWSCYVP